MEVIILDQVLEQLRAALEHDDIPRAVAIVEELRPPDQAELVSELEDSDQIALLTQLDPADSADILEKMEDEEVAELVAARLHIDPTVVSGPVMSTLVDATGLFIYFSIARVVLGL
jgi:Mg/Co/Ni transporter MgtE